MCSSCGYPSSSYELRHVDIRIHELKDQALELPKEHEMPARDKYTTFSAWDRGYRKGIHKVPKFTRVRGRFVFKNVYGGSSQSLSAHITDESERFLSSHSQIFAELIYADLH